MSRIKAFIASCMIITFGVSIPLFATVYADSSPELSLEPVTGPTKEASKFIDGAKQILEAYLAHIGPPDGANIVYQTFPPLGDLPLASLNEDMSPEEFRYFCSFNEGWKCFFEKLTVFNQGEQSGYPRTYATQYQAEELFRLVREELEFITRQESIEDMESLLISVIDASHKRIKSQDQTPGKKPPASPETQKTLPCRSDVKSPLIDEDLWIKEFSDVEASGLGAESTETSADSWEEQLRNFRQPNFDE
jgi:hypothetical protein